MGLIFRRTAVNKTVLKSTETESTEATALLNSWTINDEQVSNSHRPAYLSGESSIADRLAAYFIDGLIDKLAEAQHDKLAEAQHVKLVDTLFTSAIGPYRHS